jgi:hypothetical protein
MIAFDALRFVAAAVDAVCARCAQHRLVALAIFSRGTWIGRREAKRSLRPFHFARLTRGAALATVGTRLTALPADLEVVRELAGFDCRRQASALVAPVSAVLATNTLIAGAFFTLIG